MVDISIWEIPEYRKEEFREKKHPYCVCIPVINEGKRIRAELGEMLKCSIHRTADIIICDGGSTDGSLDIDFLQKHKITALLTKTGPGRLSAQLRMGYSYILKQGYKGVVTIDGNNKDNVDAIPKFIREMERGYSFIQGSRYLPGGRAINTPILRMLAIKLIHAPVISLLAGFRYTDTTNGYRAYANHLLMDNRLGVFRDVFKHYELLSYLSVKVPRFGYRIRELPVTRRYPKGEKIPTKISPVKGKLEYLMTLLHLMQGRFDVRNEHGLAMD